jgi:hypothetical protein
VCYGAVCLFLTFRLDFFFFYTTATPEISPHIAPLSPPDPFPIPFQIPGRWGGGAGGGDRSRGWHTPRGSWCVGVEWTVAGGRVVSCDGVVGLSPYEKSCRPTTSGVAVRNSKRLGVRAGDWTAEARWSWWDPKSKTSGGWARGVWKWLCWEYVRGWLHDSWGPSRWAVGGIRLVCVAWHVGVLVGRLHHARCCISSSTPTVATSEIWIWTSGPKKLKGEIEWSSDIFQGPSFWRISMFSWLFDSNV